MSFETDPRNNSTPPSRRDTLAQIRQQFPHTSFLALGQSVFWDEPVKAVLLQVLEEEALGGTLVVGVHDTDYFAKANLRAKNGGDPFALIPHNGGSTRDLWSAAGEISALFGSETYPTRHEFVHHGVGFERAVKASGKTRQDYLDEVTEAWGWRGLVYTGSRDLIVGQLPLREVGEGILQTLRWAFGETLKQIAPGCCQEEAERTAEALLERCRDFCSTHPDASLSDLYRTLLPRFHTLLLGKTPHNLEVTATSELLRFTPETASLPRFRFVDLFLNPHTRQTALDAYNAVMDGSGMYTLDRFGENALPFDVVLPDRGRGTLRLTPKVLFVETKKPVAIPLQTPVESIGALAKILHSRFGEKIILVGKAVSLVSMLAQEFIFVFNEEGSMYVTRTEAMNHRLREAGIALTMHPILRLKYRTWDALAEAGTGLQPAEHLAQTFRRNSLPASEFSERWKAVLEEQRTRLDTLKTLAKPREMLAYLQEHDPQADWNALAEAYHGAQHTLKALRDTAAALQREVDALYRDLKTVKASLARDYATQSEPLLAERRNLLARIARIKEERLLLERGEAAAAARRTRDDVLNQLELARVRLVRNALLTREGLTHTDHRPSFWWFPMVDSGGGWYRRLIETTEVYLQPL